VSKESQQMVASRDGGAEGSRSERGGMPLARWNPFALLDELQDEMARLWGRPMGALPAMRPSRLLAQLPMGAPRLDVFEKNGYFVVKADVPGVKKEDIQVDLEDGDLVIQGESHSEHEVKDEQLYRLERSSGRFYRRVPLPFEAKPEQIDASLRDGVLEVRIPKPAETSKESRKTRVQIK
jgi:HSP20 family protein